MKGYKKILYKKKNKSKILNKTVSSNHNLFTLFTSGSIDTQGNYPLNWWLYASNKTNLQYQFGMKENSIVLTASDAGWINGHTYSLFGPFYLDLQQF